MVSYIIFKRIKQLTIKQNLSQNEIANKLNVKRPTYAGWELGTNTITLRRLYLLSNYYKYSIDYITGLSKINNFEYSSNDIKFKVVGNNLRSLKKKVNLTQKEVATFFKIATSTYTLYELGTILIPTNCIYKIAKKLNYSMNSILKKQL